MTDFLTENSLYYQRSSFSSSYFFTNQNYKNYDFKNAIETSTNEALNDVDASFEDDSKGKTSYTRIVSASVMTSQMSAIASSDVGTAYSYNFFGCHNWPMKGCVCWGGMHALLASNG